MSVVKSRADRPCRSAEQVGDLGRGVAHVVMQDEDGAFIRREPSESALELVAVSNVEESVGRDRPVQGQDPKVRRPTTFTRGLGDADVGQQAVDPGVESTRIAKPRKVTPGDHQRILEGILGSIDVPQDPMCDREEPVATRMDQVHEGLLVAALRRLDEIAIHRRTVV